MQELIPLLYCQHASKNIIKSILSKPKKKTQKNPNPKRCGWLNDFAYAQRSSRRRRTLVYEVIWKNGILQFAIKWCAVCAVCVVCEWEGRVWEERKREREPCVHAPKIKLTTPQVASSAPRHMQSKNKINTKLYARINEINFEFFRTRERFPRVLCQTSRLQCVFWYGYSCKNV